jgi:hypothetical protein
MSTCVDIAKLYETLTLNAIAIFKFISKLPIGDLGKTLNESPTLNVIPTCKVASKYPICSLGGAFISRPRLRCNTCMQVHFEIIHR